MKTKSFFFVLVVGFLFSNQVMAESCTSSSSEEVVTATTEISTDVPSHLRGATIIVRTKDGRESSVPAERFKVVPRIQQFLVAKTQKNTETVCKNAEKNRVSAL